MGMRKEERSRRSRSQSLGFHNNRQSAPIAPRWGMPFKMARERSNCRGGVDWYSGAWVWPLLQALPLLCHTIWP